MENIDDPRSWYQFEFPVAKKTQIWGPNQAAVGANHCCCPLTRCLEEGHEHRRSRNDVLAGLRAAEGMGGEGHRSDHTLVWILNCSLRCKARELDHSNFCIKQIINTVLLLLTYNNKNQQVLSNQRYLCFCLPCSSFLARHKNVYFQALKWLFQLNELPIGKRS